MYQTTASRSSKEFTASSQEKFPRVEKACARQYCPCSKTAFWTPWYLDVLVFLKRDFSSPSVTNSLCPRLFKPKHSRIARKKVRKHGMICLWRTSKGIKHPKRPFALKLRTEADPTADFSVTRRATDSLLSLSKKEAHQNFLSYLRVPKLHQYIVTKMIASIMASPAGSGG